jgi:hypothetical protein
MIGIKRFIALLIIASHTVLVWYQPFVVHSATDVKNDVSLGASLISYWELEEASSTRFDSHGANDLTDNSTVTQAAGVQGNAADFESSNTEYLSITDAAQTGLDITGDVSFAWWWNPESYADAVYLSKITSADGYDIRAGGGDKRDLVVIFEASNNRTEVRKADYWAAADTSGGYFYVTVTIDVSGPTVLFYKNGTLQTGLSTSSSAATSIGTNSDEFTFPSVDGIAPVDGQGDELGIWTKVLTQADITALYNGGSGIPYEAPASGGGDEGKGLFFMFSKIEEETNLA